MLALWLAAAVQVERRGHIVREGLPSDAQVADPQIPVLLYVVEEEARLVDRDWEADANRASAVPAVEGLIDADDLPVHVEERQSDSVDELRAL